MSGFKSDAVQKGGLNAGLLSRRPAASSNVNAAQNAWNADVSTSAEYLESFEEQLNKKVDTEILALVDGFADCVKLAKVRGC